MEKLIANISGMTRLDKIGSTDYIVAPITLIVPGVLNGSQGPLLYTTEEIRKSPTDWNNVPLTLGHPVINGQHVSARDPVILNAKGLGKVLHASANGKLVAEAWFDIEATKRIDNSIIESLEAGNPIELSTGLFTTNEPVQNGRTDAGVEYTAIARNFKPDHLAILVNETGACSIEDGCGVLINKNKERAEMKETIDYLIANCKCWTEEDREVLNGLSEEKLTKLKENTEEIKNTEAVHNAAVAGFEDQQGSNHTFNAETKAWETKVKEVEEPVINEKPIETPKPKTAEEWMAEAPAEIQEDLTFARNEKAKQKSEIVDKLLANVAVENKPAQAERLGKRSIEDLQSDLALLPEKPVEALAANYFGQSVPGTPVDNYDQDDILSLPTADYSVEA